MVCQKGGIQFHVISEKSVEVYNGKTKYQYKRATHCIEQLNILLCRGNTNIDKENVEIIMETFQKNRHLQHILDN